MSDQANFLGQAPTQVGLVGHLESQVASKMAPQVTARFGNRLPGFSGVTLPGSGANTVGFPGGGMRSARQLTDKPGRGGDGRVTFPGGWKQWKQGIV